MRVVRGGSEPSQYEAVRIASTMLTVFKLTVVTRINTSTTRSLCLAKRYVLNFSRMVSDSAIGGVLLKSWRFAEPGDLSPPP